ncbi:MAG: DUF481 domain-containing protein [Gallionella sp.]|nr:DUF481 domain-containing protein [Gallionella sp.]MDD4959600.1 DUF481 domain-containing protein [Gallionella sp.]
MNKYKIIFSVSSLLLSCGIYAADLDGEWRGNGTLSFSKSSGNTNSSVFSASVDETRATEADKWSLYGSSMYGSSQGVKNNDKIRGGARYDFNLNPKTFAFGLGELERDSIANLSLRSTVGTGAGYHVIQNTDTSFDIMAGFTFSKSSFLQGTSKSGAELLMGEESSHKLSESTRFKQKFNIYPSLKYSGQFRSVFDASLVVDITSTIGLSVGVQHKYNTDIQPTAKRSDTFLLTGLNFKF